MVLWPSMPGEHNAMSALVRILIPELCSYSYCYGRTQLLQSRLLDTHPGADSEILEGGGGGVQRNFLQKKKGGGGGLTTYSWIRSNYNLNLLKKGVRTPGSAPATTWNGVNFVQVLLRRFCKTLYLRDEKAFLDYSYILVSEIII